VSMTAMVEAWDLNERHEILNGLSAGIDVRVWRGVAIRGDGWLLHVDQRGEDAWVRASTLSMRVRGRAATVRSFFDIGAGGSRAGLPIPPGGTRFNYVLLLGGGIEVPMSGAHVTLGARWLHFSNNGRGGHRNPDIQSLGGFAGIGWTF
jgi:hypothetical protein